MPAFEIIVQHRDGSPARGARVVLESTALLGGMSDAVYTDGKGHAIATLSTASSGILYVNGQKIGKVSAGRSVVTV